MELLAQTLSGQFSWIDWSVVIGYLVFTTVLGGALAGKQATIRDFFLGGRTLPWYAVSGSIIATEISAITFVGVPAIMFATAGNFTYLQLGVFGAILSRIIVGYVFVPAYYKREIYSPYDYMANQLGGNIRTMTTCLFTLGGMLAQGSRVFLTAMVLKLVLNDQLEVLHGWTRITPMLWSIIIIGLVAVIWTIMGGITTVIWTDVILFLVFLLGGFTALGFIIAYLPGSPWEGLKFMCKLGWQTEAAGHWGKFTFFNFSLSPTENFTVLTAMIASTWGNLGAYGTDQLIAQRMFCCKGPRDARWAIISSGVGQIIAATMLFVGLGLFAYYQVHEPTGEVAEQLAKDRDNVFPLFIITVLPTAVKGLLIAGVFAAAISSLDSILAALSQTTISAFYLPYRKRQLARAGVADEESVEGDARVVFISRLLVVFWGVILCLMALVAAAAKSKFPEILNLALSMASYAGGALLAGFMLAFLKLRVDSRGYMWSAPLSVLVVFATVWHQPWTHGVCWSGAVILLFSWLWQLLNEAMDIAELDEPQKQQRRGWAMMVRDWPQTAILVLGLAMMLWINYYGYFGTDIKEETGVLIYRTVAWPWLVPIGSSVAFVFGFLLARRKREGDGEEAA